MKYYKNKTVERGSKFAVTSSKGKTLNNRSNYHRGRWQGYYRAAPALPLYRMEKKPYVYPQATARKLGPFVAGMTKVFEAANNPAGYVAKVLLKRAASSILQSANTRYKFEM